MKLLQYTLKKSIQINYDYGIATSLMGLGVLNCHNGEYEKGIGYYKQAYYYCYKCPEKQYRVLIWSNMAGPYYRQGNINAASFCLYKALEEIRKNNIKVNALLAYIYSDVGALWINNNKNDRARFYLRKAIALTAKKQTYIPYIYLNLANTYNGENADSFYTYCEKELELGKKYNSKEAVMASYFSIGNCYINDYKPTIGIKYLDSGMAANDGNMSPITRREYYMYKGVAYKLLGDYKRAENFVNTALALEHQFKIKDNFLFFEDTMLANLYASDGNYAKAYDLQQAYYKVHDSLVQGAKDSVIDQLELQYRTAEMDKEIAQQQVNIKHQNTLIIMISGVALFLVFLIVILYLIYKHRKRLQEEKIRTIEQEKEIDELKATLRGEEKERTRLARELHDGIMGQLSAIKLNLSFLKRKYELTNAKDFNEVLQNLDEASTDLRNTAHNLVPSSILYKGLAEAVHQYCEKLNQTSDLQIHFYLSNPLPKLDSYFKLSIYRIIQELMQNILKHANASEALVQINYCDTILSITIEDNGIGFDRNSLNDNGGIGLNNITDRVKALQGKIEFKSRKKGGTLIDIEFDIANMKTHLYADKSRNYR